MTAILVSLIEPVLAAVLSLRLVGCGAASKNLLNEILRPLALGVDDLVGRLAIDGFPPAKDLHDFL
jgi:hypothetical protein